MSAIPRPDRPRATPVAYRLPSSVRLNLAHAAPFRARGTAARQPSPFGDHPAIAPGFECSASPGFPAGLWTTACG